MNQGIETGKKRFWSHLLTVMVFLVFVAYAASLIYITLIKGTTLHRIVQNLNEGRAPLRAVNLVPFQTIRDYIHYSSDMPILRWFSNLAGNLFIFVPLGLYLPVVFKVKRKLFSVLPAVFVVSLSLEALQYLFGTGSTDIDDLLLNTLGGILGFGLFSLIAEPGTASGTVRIRTLVLSLCFAAAGYTVAFREFGLYLGLARPREEIHGGEHIPSRRPDISGTVTGLNEKSFVLNRFTDGAGAAGIDVLPGPDTQWYNRQVSLRGHTQVIRYVAYAPHSLERMPLKALASVWGRWDSGRLLAEIVWTMPPSGTIGTSYVTEAAADSARIALPTEEPALHGYVKRVTADTVVINKIETWREGSGLFSVSTGIEQTFLLTSETTFRTKHILRGGQEVHLLHGTREEVVEQVLVQVWGREQAGAFVAEVVCCIDVFR
ncbi:VanZ family protein [bacterium]|nr:VanZ family protein [bacterium]